jgi:hypothetical protein
VPLIEVMLDCAAQFVGSHAECAIDGDESHRLVTMPSSAAAFAIDMWASVEQ